ncbi:MAG: hypothetical protein N2316_06125 [Spirochaetes bacterium]|nr:hypothetical protein [Spirochaetota bacterium]
MRFSQNLLGFSNSMPVFVFIAVLYVISQVAIAVILHPLNIFDVLLMQVTLSDTTIRAIVQRWMSEKLIERFVMHFYFDFVHPLLYGILLTLFMRKVFQRISFPQKWNFFLLLPWIAVMMDVFENCLHLYFVVNIENITRISAVISGLASIVKWSMIGVSAMSMGLLYSLHCICTAKNRSKNSKAD